ncbi:MAG TPA: hypothetical protein VN366_06915 [Feifaniaceae bacterium]|nr:hypothetical protein [Feifaniaceae bacterium]
MSVWPSSSGEFDINRTVLSNDINRLLVNNAHWTREYILISAYEAGELEAVADQLVQSAVNMARFFGGYYGQERAAVLESLLSVYNYYAIRTIDALRANDPQQAEEMRREWSDSAEAIAQFMSEQNRNIDQYALQALFQNLIELTEEEATQVFSGEYAASIEKYMEIIDYVVNMAWDISSAISNVVRPDLPKF